MTKEEKAIRDFCGHHADWWPSITQVQEMLALAQPEQKYHRGDRLICLETEEYCVIHISCTDRQWVKFPDLHIGVYTNEQVAELFELLPKEPEQEPTYTSTQATNCAGCGEHKHTPLRIDAMGGYVCLTCIDKKLGSLLGEFGYEQPEQEPVAWMDKDGDVLSASVVSGKGLRNIPLYTTPPQSKPLTDEQIFEINNGLATWMFPVETRVTDRELAFARAIEAAHGIKDKNT